jgi:hypothetical protein
VVFNKEVVLEELHETIDCAKMYGPTEPAVYQDDNEDDLRGLAPLFIKQEVTVLSALSKLQRARTDQLRKVVGPPTTTLDLKDIVSKYLCSAIDRDEAYVWSNESLGYLVECLLQNNMHEYKELDAEVERLQGYLKDLDLSDEEDEEDADEDEDEDEARDEERGGDEDAMMVDDEEKDVEYV